MHKVATKMTLLALTVACTQAWAFGETSKGKVLIVVSSENQLTLKDGKTHPTGFFLNEMAVPVKTLVDAGYEPVFADPRGNTPTMDTKSDNPRFFAQDENEYKTIKHFADNLPGLKQPQPLDKIAAGDLKQYAGIFVPGGHAPMEDLWRQPALGKILRYFHAHNKPTVLICHGPIALLSSLENADTVTDSVEKGKPAPKKLDWPYRGYQMTVFSDAEEKPNEPGSLGGYMKFYPEDALKAAGAVVSVSPPKESHVVKDRELITGQNPFSDKELAAAFVKALNAQCKPTAAHKGKTEKATQ